jgi:hypothetical protein
MDFMRAPPYHRRPHMHPRPALPPVRLRRIVLTGALAAAVCVCAALLTACGGSSAGAATSGAAAAATATGLAPTPVPSPIITADPPPTGAVAVVREFWELVGQGHTARAMQDLVAPGSPMSRWMWDGSDVADAHMVRVYPGYVSGGPVPGATVMVAASVWIEPSAGNTPWGDPGEHELFESVVRMSDGSWRMWESGTSP